jgi:hypothetical protein
LNEHSKNQNPHLQDFETGCPRRRKSEDKGPKKARRVSQRRELAVVTLGTVASIAGLGGFLAANPPSWATAPENATPEIAVTAQADPGGASHSDDVAIQRQTGADSTAANVESAPIVEGGPSESPAEQAEPAASRAPVEAQQPAWSAPSQAPAAAESRGS